VIGGLQGLGGADRACRAMLGSLVGPEAAANIHRLGDLTAGFATLAGVRQPGSGLRADGRRLLVADLRFDDRAGLGERLGLGRPETERLADIDLLWRALLRWGEEAPEHLAGDFAFAWSEGRRLLLARDALGQRPLYWSRHGQLFAFASMPRGLHALPGLVRAPDLASLARYVAGLPESGPATFFQNIRRVEPGHILVVTDEATRARRYWQPTLEERAFSSFDEEVEAFRAVLDQAVAERLRDAGPVVASHLSGGWDSAAVTATAARLAGPDRRLLAFTAVPADPPHPVDSRSFADEWPLAAATAAHYPNVRHRRVPSAGADIVETLTHAAKFLERPPHNPCNHGWLARIRAAARVGGAHVLLTGEIGNWSISAAPSTILASYLHEGRWRDWAREAAAMLAQRRARLRGVAATSFGPWLPPGLMRRLSGLAAAPTLPIALDEAMLAPLTEEIEARSFGSLAWPRNHRERTLAAYREMDFGAYRKGILTGWGVDKRDATADLRLIEFCLRLPLEMLLGNGTRRPLARAALSDRLPAKVLTEGRKGLQAADWYLDLERSRPAIEALVDEIERHSAAGALVDTGLLRQWIREWPGCDWNRPDHVARYRIGLLVALAAGHFAIHASRQSPWGDLELGLASSG
jgi:asparagine synthase (glutamine-hydrolysing)